MIKTNLFSILFSGTALVDQIEASLMSAMKGRYWAGKGAVLKATVALTKLCPGDMLPKIPKLIERFMRVSLDEVG